MATTDERIKAALTRSEALPLLRKLGHRGSISARARQRAIWLLLGGDDPNGYIDHEELHRLCKRHGCYNKANHTLNLNKEVKRGLLKGSFREGWWLTDESREIARKLIADIDSLAARLRRSFDGMVITKRTASCVLCREAVPADDRAVCDSDRWNGGTGCGCEVHTSCLVELHTARREVRDRYPCPICSRGNGGSASVKSAPVELPKLLWVEGAIPEPCPRCTRRYSHQPVGFISHQLLECSYNRWTPEERAKVNLDAEGIKRAESDCYRGAGFHDSYGDCGCQVHNVHVILKPCPECGGTGELLPAPLEEEPTTTTEEPARTTGPITITVRSTRTVEE